MDPMSLGAAALIGGGSLASGFLSFLGGQSANAMTEEMAEKNRMFQYHMSNTAYQRAMLDMKLAGLNPMLAIDKGGASTPSGSSGSFQNPGSPLGGLSPALEAVLNMRSNTVNNARTMVETENSKKQAPILDAQGAKAQAEASTAKVVADENARRLKGEADMINAQAVKTRAEADFYKKNPNMIPIQKALEVGTDLLNSASGVKDLLNIGKKRIP